MKFLSLEPFVPSGKDFSRSRQLFIELGFTAAWGTGDYVGFERDGCKFILQRYDNKEFAENFMISVKITSAEEFWKDVQARNIPEQFGVRVSKPTVQPYGIEVNVIDIAGVCWHFVE